MINSSKSFTSQTDFFARLLSQKLETFDNDSKSDNICQGDYHKRIKSSSSELQWIFDNGIHSSDRIRANMPPIGQVFGTTFPPNKFVSCDLIRAKFQKESSLLRQIYAKNKQVCILLLKLFLVEINITFLGRKGPTK